MLLLFETAAGYALFKVLKEKRLEEAEDLAADFQTLDQAQKIVKLKAFSKFENTTEALAAATALVDSKLGKGLKKFLKKNVNEDETLAVLDKKLGGIVQEKLGLNVLWSNQVLELSRGIRNQLTGLISGLAGADLRPMSLGLSHSLSRYKLKFSPEKVDTMIVQAIGLLDDLDKELNTYAMRVREWYGWHFPEMTKIVTDNIQYAKAVVFMGTRDQVQGLDFSGILEEDVEGQLKAAAQVSMGTDISESDLDNIKDLANQVIALSEYRGQLFEYLRNRMSAIAPNLTVLVGELVGARLIAHAGSLINLAKQPASTVQILGAEKALFRALKTKHETPKYGLIYHASLIGQSAPKYKGKISRVLAAKCALAIRVDALGDTNDATVGVEARQKVEARLRQLEGKLLGSEAGTSKGKEQPAKYDKSRQGATPTMATQPKAYNPDSDVINGTPAEKKEKKEKKKKAEEEAPAPEDEQPKKKKKAAALESPAVAEEQPKKKKAKVADGEANGQEEEKKAKKEKEGKKKKKTEE
ncbi:hypothetical protein VOLCADRAFT_102990 [Volvox carteri f. nagariensis]|uniref:Nop domain-containing protein n=1 Tax=Volvox carteri f. nagariensis TaxID=3068 RepID=D8TJ80_VOLCA|nr:uncharacterized protein VOLCADRAFT_102990 [Volvox carteri f. nagariensis]EFJ52329.1 hypothetical protein VOLCADRAFT_102990 [Volvox carteri f. nagariensis]|eukprot:XP_002946402.1 hypothetical protein VOLCADRAFT_102990 [Volvox carteri f. nagariensis]